MTDKPPNPPPEESGSPAPPFDPSRYANPGNPLLGGICVLVGVVLFGAGGLCFAVFPQGILISGPLMIVGALLCWGGTLLWRGEGGWWAVILLVLVGLGALFLVGLCAGPGYI